MGKVGEGGWRMGVSSGPATKPVDGAALHRFVQQEALPRLGERSDALAGVELSFPSSTSSYTTVDVNAWLEDGRRLRLFLKDFGYSRLPKDDPEGRRARELYVYRELLANTGIGTAEYYGSLGDERDGRAWLLLEFVEGATLRSCAFDGWAAAAAWLGRLQSLFAAWTDRLQGASFLIRHDDDYFLGRAEDAQRDMEAFSGTAKRRIRDLLSGYEELIPVMTSEPRTLVHGNYRPNNVLIDASVEPWRVCPVDWEVAAIGSTLYDLALLADGYAGSRLEKLLDAYDGEARAVVLLHDRASTLRRLDCFCLHRVVKSLGRAVEKGFREEDITDLLDHGEALRRRIF
jgi:aminoglycoside phosphotransferase (APT) family kinase protein